VVTTLWQKAHSADGADDFEGGVAVARSRWGRAGRLTLQEWHAEVYRRPGRGTARTSPESADSERNTLTTENRLQAFHRIYNFTTLVHLMPE
jgi:hypothetical protein